MNAESLEKFLRIFLPSFLVTAWLITVALAVDKCRAHDSWIMGDWLINYHGGFTRRGLTGEIAIGLARITSLNVGSVVVILQSLCYGIYFAFSYLLLRKTSLLPYAMLIVSPFIFSFQINDSSYGFKKEIIYFALLAFLAWSKCSLRRDLFEKIFFTALPLYALAILSHEMLILFVPYLFILYIIDTKPSRKRCGLVVLGLLPALAGFLFAVHFKGTPTQTIAIYDVLTSMNYVIPKDGGGIGWLGATTQSGINAVRENLSGDALYLPAAALAWVAFIPLHNTLRLLFADKGVAILFLFSLAGTIILAIVAFDWGRFIYIHLVSLFILVLVTGQIWPELEKVRQQSVVSPLTVFLILIWALAFYIPGSAYGQPDIIIKSIENINYFRPAYHFYQRRTGASPLVLSP